MTKRKAVKKGWSAEYFAVTSHGTPLPFTGLTRDLAKRQWLAAASHTWDYWRRRGCKVERVLITVQP